MMTKQLIAVTFCFAGTFAHAADQPNVIIVLTDDQGYGDLSCTGNPVMKTPELDQLHDQSVRFTDFHVAPICTPTRSQLLTGRDCLANSAYCVCSGHGFIRPEVPTMAGIFAAGGYRTGMFGKWHLGDTYPYRPQDRGFQETLTFRGYGMQAMSSHWNCEYMDPWLLRNGHLEQTPGYCTDIFFSEMMKWIKTGPKTQQPFFAYLPLNAAHSPMQVPDSYAQPYRQFGEGVAKFFGMIANIDENVGRLNAFLKETGRHDNTIVIFMTDNGGTAGVPVYNADMKGGKGQYYNGGHRVPCFVRWPAGGLREPGDVATHAEVQDILPTLIDLCCLTQPPGAKFDGASLAPLLRGKTSDALSQRMMVVQCALWDEYQAPHEWAGAVLWNQWQLFKGKELYDLRQDPGQKHDIAAQHPEVVAAMRKFYQQWWNQVEPLSRDFPPFHLGSPHEPTTLLTSHDWVAPDTADQPQIRGGINLNGPWHVLVEQAGDYEIVLRRWPAELDIPLTAPSPAYHGKLANYPAGKALPIAKARLQIAMLDESQQVTADQKTAVFNVKLPAGRTTLQTWFYNAAGEQLCGAYYVTCRKMQ